MQITDDQREWEYSMSVFTEFSIMEELHRPGGKVVLLVMDGVGGLPMEAGGLTELDVKLAAKMDALA